MTRAQAVPKPTDDGDEMEDVDEEGSGKSESKAPSDSSPQDGHHDGEDDSSGAAEDDDEEMPSVVTGDDEPPMTSPKTLIEKPVLLSPKVLIQPPDFSTRIQVSRILKIWLKFIFIQKQKN